MAIKAQHIALIVGLLVLSLADMVTDWLNWSLLQSLDYQYGFVAGPPTIASIDVLLFFNVLGTALSVFEIANTFSMLLLNFTPRVPFEVEQAAVFVLEEMPLALTNLAIVVCRARQTTTLQIVSGAFGLANVTVRFIFLASLSARLSDRLQEPRSARSISYAVCSFIWVVFVILQGLIMGGLNTRPVNHGLAQSDLLGNNSVYLLHAPGWDIYSKVSHLDITEKLRQQGMPADQPWLVKDLYRLADDKTLFTTDYICANKNNTGNHALQPSPCGDGSTKTLRFRFLYSPNSQTDTTPMGVIMYAVGAFDFNDICREIHWESGRDWKLMYFKNEFPMGVNDTINAVVVSSPWDVSCTGVYPKYATSLPACPTDIYNYVNAE